MNDAPGGRIIRRLLPFERNFTGVPNEWVRDARLSPKALGLLVIILSHKDGWSISLGQLAKERKKGLDYFRTARDELEQLGYLIRRTTRRGLADDWEICDPTGLSDPALIGYREVRDLPVDNYPLGKSDRSENPRGTPSENPTLKENYLRNNSIPSATTVVTGSPVDKSDASGGVYRTAGAVAGKCKNGHPILGKSGGGVPFCALGCAPADSREAVPA